MQLEKLDLLEKELGRFIERFEQLREENELLRQRLDAQTAQLNELTDEVDYFRATRTRIVECLGRIGDVTEKLQDLQASEAGEEL